MKTIAPAEPRAARADRAADKLPSFLFAATLLFLIVVLVRPQDIFPALGILQLGIVAIILLLVAVMQRLGRVEHFRDTIVKASLAFVFALACGLIVVVNHYKWFWTLYSVSSYVVAFIIAMPLLIKTPHYRDKLFLALLLSFGVAAVYAITHQGKGQGDWLGDENDMSGAMALGFCVSVAYSLAPGSRPLKWLGWVVAALSVAGIVIAGSRGGMVGFAFGVLGLAYFSGRLVRSLVVAALVAALAFPFVPDEMKNDLASISDQTDSTRVERLYSWGKGWEMFVGSPLLGVGASNYPWRIGDMQNLSPDVGQPDYWRSLAGRVAHSSYVTVLSETGLLGTIPYAVLILTTLLRCRRAIYGGGDCEDWQKFIAFAAGSGILAYGVSAAFITVTYAPPLFMLAGLTIALPNSARAARPKQPRP